MRADNKPPSFAQLVAREIERSATARGWRAFIPWWLAICAAAPFVFEKFAEPYLNKEVSSSDAIAILAAIAVVSSFMGSTSIALTAHLQKVVSEYPFCNYLKEENLFDSFLFWPQFVLLIQITSVFISIASAVIVGLFKGHIEFSFLIIMSVSITIYSFEKTWKLIDLIREATWYYELYQSLYNDAR